MKITLIILLNILISLPAFAKTYKYNSVYDVPTDTKVRASVWHKHMKPFMKKNLCVKDSLFRKCYSVKKSYCQLDVNKMYNQCARTYTKSKYIKPRHSSGRKVASLIGKCIAYEYNEKHGEKKKANKGC